MGGSYYVPYNTITHVHMSDIFCVESDKKGLEVMQPSQLVERCRELLQNPNKKPLFALVRLLLDGSIIGHENMAAIPLFIHFHCFLKDGLLLSPDGVSHVCAKLLHIMDLSVLELVAAETGD